MALINKKEIDYLNKKVAKKDTLYLSIKAFKGGEGRANKANGTGKANKTNKINRANKTNKINKADKKITISKEGEKTKLIKLKKLDIPAKNALKFKS